MTFAAGCVVDGIALDRSSLTVTIDTPDPFLLVEMIGKGRLLPRRRRRIEQPSVFTRFSVSGGGSSGQQDRQHQGE